MRILITGVSGFIGRHIAQTLKDEGHQVVGCVRNLNERHYPPGIEVIQGDFSIDHSARVWRPRVTGFDAVINAVGIIRQQGSQTFHALHTKAPIALFRACEEMGVKRIIQISALGADKSAFSHYHLSKKAADDYLSSMKLEWLILMPSIVYGTGAKSMAFFKALSSLPLIPLIGLGDQMIQPIHISDLTRLVTKCINTDNLLRQRLVVAGPTPIAIKSLLTELRSWLGIGSAKFLSIPYPIAQILARLGGISGNTPLTNETVTMLQRSNTGDIQPFIEHLGQAPQDIHNVLAETPAKDPDRWHAKLYFLSPVLRISIAFVWVFTGYISAFVFPRETSFALLSQVGISAVFAPLFLYGAAAFDIALGIATVVAYRIQILGWIQVLLILLYTLIISLYLPDQWLHPFGPITKNLPMVMAIFIMMILEKR
ncbi:MAG: SDR family oxidoreductase [Candidatus Thiodiazotropha sp.]|jgi:nucleoside-diphosphate-sugar epimerase